MIEGSHVSREMLGRLARRELAPREVAELLRHVGECESCANAAAAVAPEEQLDALQLTFDDEAFDDDGPWHPDHADLAAYADGTAGPAEREIAASHVEDCALCREDVADLVNLRRALPRRRGWRGPLAAAAAVAALVVVLVERNGTDEPAPQPVHPRAVANRPPLATALPKPREAAPRYANAEWDRLVRTAIATGRLPFADGVDLPPDMLRGAGGVTAQEVAPAGVVIDATRPRFSWPRRDGAVYVVSIFSGDRRVGQSEPLTDTRWTPQTPLARGRSYVWQVEATRDREREIIPAPPAPPATFRIVSSRDHEELLEARRRYPGDPLLHAVLAARAGLRAEALDALSRAHTNIAAH